MTNVADEWIPSKSFSISRDDAFNHLKENYTSPSHPLGFMGIDNIYRFYNGVLSKERIKHFLASTEVYSLIKQEKINPKKIWTPIISFHYLDLVQADLIEVSTLSNSNLGVKFLLCVLDCFSRFLWIQPTIDKTGEKVADAMNVIFGFMEHLPKNLTTDMGKEFDNKLMKRFLKKMNINFYTSVSENKCSMVEIAQKNIQRRIYAHLLENESLDYIEYLPHVCYAYNNSYHRSIAMTPVQAKQNENFQKIQMQNLVKFHKMKEVKVKPRFKIGDIVRVSLDKRKNTFARSYNLQNSYAKYEIYKISTKNTVHAKYFLKHVASNEVINNGYFYDWQLTLCTNLEFRGNVIKTRKRKGKTEYLFTYKGYPSHFEEWKTTKDISAMKLKK